MRELKCFFMTCMLLITFISFAQNVEVSGIIKDAKTGEAIPFASVVLKGTMIGVSANASGVYQINLSQPKTSVLVFSSVGYKDREVLVGDNTNLNVSLDVSNVLDEIVVVAYGTVKKEAVTGSVSSVKGSSIANTPVTSVDKMLSGKLAGVEISSASGAPGSFSNIRIRGIGSITANNNPLWVIDGIPIDVSESALFSNSNSSLTALNPSDIENITVLKDAAAAAVYGSRASNGVILVTTKQGKEGKTSFELKAKYGLSWYQNDIGFRPMNGQEYLSLQRDAAKNAGYSNEDIDKYLSLDLLKGKQTNWEKELFRLGNLSEYEVSARSGNSKSNIYTSLFYQNNKGIFHGMNYDKLGTRLNTNYEILKSLTMGLNLNLSYSKNSTVEIGGLLADSPLLAYTFASPFDPVRNEDGSFNFLQNLLNGNPLAAAKYNQNVDKRYVINTTMSLKWAPTKHLVIETKDNADMSFSNGRRLWHPKATGVSRDLQIMDETLQYFRYTTSNTITYNNVFSDYHNIRLLAGQEALYTTLSDFYLRSYDISPEMPEHISADTKKTELLQNIANTSLLSFFGIADYNYANKYFVQANIRSDGSSVFGDNRRWGLFGAVSASWNITRENFWKYSPINLLKLRVSYGVNGNNDIAPYLALRSYDIYKYNGITGYDAYAPGNPNMSWEKNHTVNFGIDYAMLDNRITANLDIYSRTTTSLLMGRELPWTTSWSRIFTNVGSVRNSGVELQLSANIIQGKDWLWNISTNFAYNNNKVLSLNDNQTVLGTSFVRTVVGKSMNTYYLYDYYGVNPSNGEALWRAEDGSLTNNQREARRTYAGSPDPKYMGGLTSSLSWKGLELSLSLDYKGGHKVWVGNLGNYNISDGANLGFNQLLMASQYWKKEGDIGVLPKPVYDSVSNSNIDVSTRWLYNGSFLRVKDLTLAYTLPKKVLSRIGLKNLRLYVSGLNLYCFNKVYGMDPERGTRGAAVAEYPITKSVIGGIEISF